LIIEPIYSPFVHIDFLPSFISGTIDPLLNIPIQS
jgi:hypothetical protein